MKEFHFRLTSEHLKLLKNSRWTWASNGTPCMDPEHPYGDFDVIGSMPKILGYSTDEDFDHPQDLECRMNELHEEIITAIEIIFRTGSMELGLYRASYDPERFQCDWSRISD